MQNLIKKITPNEKQMECIKTLDGPVMVLAGPGTGKTFTVIQRIKYMLEQGIPPEVILCLTFTEPAANEMKARLVKEIGTIASSVVIHTYHAFCNEIIRQYPSEFELLDGVNLIDDITKRNLMKECLDEFNPEFYRTKWGDAYYYITDLIGAVSEIKKSQVKKEDYFNTLNTSPLWQGKLDEYYADKIEQVEKEKKGVRNRLKTVTGNIETHERKMGKAKEAWALYELYNLKLKKNNFIDFNDMINLVLETFDNNEDFLKKVSQHYKYFLVDEYQDTNLSQNNIVFKLAEGSNNQNIFVVGDDDQIIYGFQGAQTDNLEKFLLRYPDTKVICLNENNRSTQTILDLSYEIISEDKTRLELNPEFNQYNISKKLTAKNEKIICNDKKVQIHGFEDIKQENNFIVEDIERLIKSTATGEVDLSQIAVFARKNDELKVFVELLKAKNIPYQVKLNKSIFELKPSIITYFYLKALENNEFHADKLFGLLLSHPFDFARADYNFLLTQNQLTHKDFISTIRDNIDRDWADKDKIKGFIETYDVLQEVKSVETLKNLIVEIINQTGILECFLKSKINKIENIFAIKKLVDEAASFANLHTTSTVKDFIEHLDMAYADKVMMTIDSDDYVQNAVQLLTMHGSKGREFEYVYIPNLITKNWEKKNNKNSVDLPIEKSVFPGSEEDMKKAEQLKLLFVGVTRAKHSLVFTFSNIIEGKSQELTSYLSSITEREDLFERFNHELSNEDYADEVAKSFTIAQFNHKEAFVDEVRARIKDLVLSPSTLNSYLNCPRDFLYSYILHIPVSEGDMERASYGSAVHKSLEYAMNEAKEKGTYPALSEFLQVFNKKLANQKFASQTKRDEYSKRGASSLGHYYPHFVQTSSDSVFATEYKLDFVPVDKYFIKGFIDRIETNNDCTYSLYDYKTQSAKSKSKISDGKEYEHYLNQLRFYKLAFEIQNVGAKVSQVGLLFVEEHEKSFFTTLLNEDNEYIKEKIINTYENIHNLNFDAIEYDDDKCKYCSYKQLCRLDVL